MQVVLKIINNSETVDNYDYSDEVFFHNDKIIDVDNKFSKLVYLTGLTSEWEEKEVSYIDNGFYICVNVGSHKKEYFINSSNVDLLIFISEIKRIEMEGK